MCREVAVSQPNPYEVLGVGADATSAEVARAYRRLARMVHPDSRPGDPAAATDFQAVSDAYELLSDPARRADYDRQHPPRPVLPPHRPGPAGPDLWPSPVILHAAPPGSPEPGAALRAGPVHIQPLAPDGGGNRAHLDADPELAQLLYRLIVSRRMWPW
jgi:hypothetical protein